MGPHRTELVISGAVTSPGTLSREELEALPSFVADVSPLADGAVGGAVHLRDVVERVSPSPDALFCTVISRSGDYRASIPIEHIREGGWLATSLGGDSLPADRGGPLRLTVADGTTLCWNVKDVGELRFTVEAEPDSVPENPPH